jgi:hypothetical protein
MANYLQLLGEPEAYEPARNNGLACLLARWSDEKVSRLLNELPDMMEQAAVAARAERAG